MPDDRMPLWTGFTIAQAGNKSEDICRPCTRQVVVWIAFLVLIVLLSPVLVALRDGTFFN